MFLGPRGEVEFTPIFFVVPKRNSDWWSILYLKFLNKFLQLRHFHMESLRSITEALQPWEFLTSLYLKEAYLHIPILPALRKYQRFWRASLIPTSPLRVVYYPSSLHEGFDRSNCIPQTTRDTYPSIFGQPPDKVQFARGSEEGHQRSYNMSQKSRLSYQH